MQEFFEKNLIFLDLSIYKIRGAGENRTDNSKNVERQI